MQHAISRLNYFPYPLPPPARVSVQALNSSLAQSSNLLSICCNFTVHWHSVGEINILLLWVFGAEGSIYGFSKQTNEQAGESVLTLGKRNAIIVENANV